MAVSQRNLPVLLALSIALLPACFTVEEPPCPKIEIPDTGGECSTTCDCPDMFAGKAYRLTSNLMTGGLLSSGLEIDEPDAFASTLNTMWATDIYANTLNVLFVVEDFKPGTAAAFDELTVRGGPAWRDPASEWVMPPESGQPSSSVIDSYCLLKDMSVSLKVLPYHGNQCAFKTVGSGSLFFHSGPINDPLVCAPGVNPPNNIPIKNLKVRFNFNKDCSQLDGFMEGCLTVEDSRGICMCLITGECKITDAPDPNYDRNNLSDFCKKQCGSGWLSFDKTIHAFELTPTCETEQLYCWSFADDAFQDTTCEKAEDCGAAGQFECRGKPGYRVQGFIHAEAIDGKYDPVPSTDCVSR